MLSPSLTSTTALLAGLVFWTPSAEAFAETAPSSPVALLEVQGPEVCATRAELSARTIGRAPRVRFVDAGGELTVRVRFVVQQSGDVASEVLFTKADGSSSTRRLVARSCAEATNAVALIIAVTLDPAAAEDSRSSGTREGAPASDPERSALSPGETPPDAAPDEGPADSPRVPARRRFGAYLSAQALFGTAPKVMPAVALNALLGLDRSALWSPALVVGFSHGFGTSIGTGADTSGARAVFTLDVATLDACPFRFELPGVEVRGCGFVLLGRLSAAGRSTFNSPGAVTRPFSVVGASAVLTAPIASWLEALGHVGAGANLVRDSFEFTPVPFYEVGPVTVGASIGLGSRIP